MAFGQFSDVKGPVAMIATASRRDFRHLFANSPILGCPSSACGVMARAKISRSTASRNQPARVPPPHESPGVQATHLALRMPGALSGSIESQRLEQTSSARSPVLCAFVVSFGRIS